MTFLLAPGIKGLNVCVGRTSEISIANVDFFCHLDLKRWWLLKLRLFYKSNKRCRAFFDQLVWNFSIVAQLQTWWKFGLFPIVFWSVAFILDKKWSFPLRVSLVNVSKSAVFLWIFSNLLKKSKMRKLYILCRVHRYLLVQSTRFYKDHWLENYWKLDNFFALQTLGNYLRGIFRILWNIYDRTFSLCSSS